MKFKITYIITLIISINIFPSKDLYPENNYSGFTYIISGGPSYIQGFFKDYIDQGFTSRINAYYNYPVFTGNTYFKGGVSYSDYTLGSGKDSTIKQHIITGGVGFFYSIFSFIDLLAGIDYNQVYSHLITANTGREELSIKPGVSFNLGVMTYLGRGIGLSVIADYRSTRISDNNFNAVDITAGLTYNYNAFIHEQERNSKSEKKLTIFNQGLAEFKKKNFNDAKSLLKELYSIDKNYPGLDYYMKRIEEIELNQKTAETLISQQNYLRAIPYLEGCSAYIKDCELKLLSQRKTLKSNVPDWETEGIKLYDGKNYRACIDLMEKIILVDPENQNANIYLPRAIKRQKAIESLQGR